MLARKTLPLLGPLINANLEIALWCKEKSKRKVTKDEIQVLHTKKAMIEQQSVRNIHMRNAMTKNTRIHMRYHKPIENG